MAFAPRGVAFEYDRVSDTSIQPSGSRRFARGVCFGARRGLDRALLAVGSSTGKTGVGRVDLRLAFRRRDHLPRAPLEQNEPYLTAALGIVGELMAKCRATGLRTD